MIAENVRVGHAVFFTNDDGNTKVYVVGSSPEILAGNRISFNQILKKNGRNEFFVSSQPTILNLDDNREIEDAVVMLPTLDNMLANDEIAALPRSLRATANDKYNWILDNLIDAPGHDVNVEVLREDVVEGDQEAEAPQPDIVIHDDANPQTYRYYISITANEDPIGILEETLDVNADIEAFNIIRLE
jgi:hypothetical protein